MKTNEKRHKEQYSAKDKKVSKIKGTSDSPEVISNAESSQSIADVEDLKNGIAFHVNFLLKEGQIKGKITHRLTKKHVEFDGLDQNSITQFMKGYLSRLEKSVEKMPAEEPPPQFLETTEAQSDEAKITVTGEMQTRSFGLVPAGSTQPTELLRQGQPFQLQWSFEPPTISDMEGKQLCYRIVISGKNLEGGERLKIGNIKGQIGFGSVLTARIPSEPLPPGAYWLEADSDFSLKSKVAEWRSACHERRLIQVI
jgi:hypothetical protein